MTDYVREVVNPLMDEPMVSSHLDVAGEIMVTRGALGDILVNFLEPLVPLLTTALKTEKKTNLIEQQLGLNMVVMPKH